MMMFSIRRPQYLISHRTSQWLPVLTCLRHKMYITFHPHNMSLGYLCSNHKYYYGHFRSACCVINGFSTIAFLYVYPGCLLLIT